MVPRLPFAEAWGRGPGFRQISCSDDDGRFYRVRLGSWFI